MTNPSVWGETAGSAEAVLAVSSITAAACSEGASGSAPVGRGTTEPVVPTMSLVLLVKPRDLQQQYLQFLVIIVLVHGLFGVAQAGDVELDLIAAGTDFCGQLQLRFAADEMEL